MTQSDRTPGRIPLPRRALLAGVLLLFAGPLLLVLLGIGRSGAPSFHGTVYDPPMEAPRFTLMDHTGEAASLADFRGSTLLLFFGFVNCPDVCPLTLARLERATETLGRRAAETRILLVTVDPERDSPDALAAYVRNFGPRVTGLTGEPAELERIRAAYGAYAEHHAGAEEHHPQVIHSSQVFGIDRHGQLRVLLRADGPEEELLADLRALLSL